MNAVSKISRLQTPVVANGAKSRPNHVEEQKVMATVAKHVEGTVGTCIAGKCCAKSKLCGTDACCDSPNYPPGFGSPCCPGTPSKQQCKQSPNDQCCPDGSVCQIGQKSVAMVNVALSLKPARIMFANLFDCNLRAF